MVSDSNDPLHRKAAAAEKVKIWFMTTDQFMRRETGSHGTKPNEF